MRAVFSTFGPIDDVQAMLALAAKLLRAGHQPIVAFSPDYADRAGNHGIEFVPIGPAISPERTRSVMAAQMQNPHPVDQLRYSLEAELPHLPGICQSLGEICRNADVLIGSPHHLACSIVHQTTSIPYVALHVSHLANLGGAEVREMRASVINSYRIQEGLLPVQDPAGCDGDDGQLALYALSRHLLQGSARKPGRGKVVGFLFHEEKGWEPERDLEDFCSGGGSPVVVSFGSMFHSDPAGITDLLVEAARLARCRMIIQGSWEDPAKRNLPAEILVTGFASHARLFSRAALVVHHGGAGTTAAALRVGTPAVVVPHILDEPIWAELARAKGCAKNVIPLPHLNASRLAAAIRTSLASSLLYEQAAALGAKIRAEDGVQTARKLIEEFVARCQRPVEVVAGTNPAKATPLSTPIVRARQGKEIPLSFAQQRLWFADQMEHGSTSYNMPFLWRFEGEMHPSVLRRVIKHIVQRHEILRTTFPVRNGMPVQEIAPEMEIPLEEIDLQSLGAEEREAELMRIATQEAMLPFDLAQGPLWRMKWLRLDAERHALLGVLHHIVSDGWSQEIMSKEISQLYEAYVKNEPVALSSLEVQYADYAVWQRASFSGEATEAQLAYWRKQLDGLPVLELPTDYPRPAIKGHRGGSTRYQLSGELTEKLKVLGRREGATLFMVVLAALQVLLSKYAGQDDVAVGTPIAGRTRKELEGVIGCFINMLTLRMDLSGNPDFREVVRRARHACLESYQHQDIPFEKIVQELQPHRDVSRTPLFQMMLVFQTSQMIRPKLHGLRFIGSVDLVESAPFDLTLELIESQGIRCRLSYASDLYNRDTASRMLDHLNRVLETMVAAPELKLADFSFLTPAESQQLLVEWNGPDLAYSSENCIHEVFEQQAKIRPSALALEFEGQTLTYREFNRRANQMAHFLRKAGVGPETPVAICMERCPDMMTGMLGILKAGGAYVPLDPSLPKERIRWMVNDLESPVVLTHTGIAAKLNLPGHVLCLDEPQIRNTLLREKEENPELRTHVSNAAYIIYTSGSTGKPKAVVATHDGLVNLAQFQKNFFGVTPQDRVLQFVATSFDPSIGDCFTGWAAGASVILGPDPRQTLGRDLAHLIETQRISYTGITPSMLASMEDAPLPGLKVLLTGGAPCSEELMCRWSKGRRMFNVYGPTETTICAVSTELSSGDGRVPIGSPIANAKVYVLDKDMNPVPVGMRGELYIGGVGLTRGYWKRPDLTADRFMPNIFSSSGGERLYRTGDIVRWRMDKKLEFVGRADEQIKIREQRIELGEIEAVLRQREDIKDALVIALEEQPGDKRLIAYVVPEKMGREELLPGELRAALREELPVYMVPSCFVIMNALPLNSSGKIDRRRLPAPADPGAAAGPLVTDAVNELERRIADVWGDVLGIGKVDVHDNFFDIGGDSFKSIRVQTELVKILGREIKVLELFRFPTVRSLAEHLAQQAAESIPAKDSLRPESLDAGRERLKRQRAQRVAPKTRGTSATVLIN